MPSEAVCVKIYNLAYGYARFPPYLASLLERTLKAFFCIYSIFLL